MEIQKIWQIDRYTLGLVWEDGLEQHIPLAVLQNHCPCVKCSTLKERKDVSILQPVSARSVRNVGRYAIQVVFTTGCSFGIYHFEQIREIGESVE